MDNRRGGHAAGHKGSGGRDGTRAGHVPRTPSQGARQPWPGGLAGLSIAAALMGAASTAIWTFGADILRQEPGFDDRRIAVAWLVLGGAGLLGVASGPGANRLGIAAIHRIALALTAAGAALSAAAIAAPRRALSAPRFPAAAQGGPSDRSAAPETACQAR